MILCTQLTNVLPYSAVAGSDAVAGICRAVPLTSGLPLNTGWAASATDAKKQSCG